VDTIRDVWLVEVEASTHDDLRAGVLAIPRGPGRTGPTSSFVAVSAHDAFTDTAAMCIAAQVAACTSRGMPTRTTVRARPS
jgi:hypothetical protein